MRRAVLAVAVLLAPGAALAGLPLLLNLNLSMPVTGGTTRAGGSMIPVASVNMAAGDSHAPAAATDAVVTYAASPGYHVITGIAWSYDAAPTGGLLTISDGSTLSFTMTITAAGSGIITFPVPKRGTFGTAMTVTLTSGGGAVVGKVNVLGHWIEFP